MIRWLGWIVIGLFLSGCAVGNRYAYHSVVAAPKVSGTGAVSVATHDQREYVRSGDKSPQFVGLQRGGFGNPFDVRTEDDRPLADAMTDALVNVALIYDVTLAVLDRAGAVLTQKRLQGRDNLGGDAWNPPSHARVAVPRAFKAKLEELLDDGAVAGSLR